MPELNPALHRWRSRSALRDRRCVLLGKADPRVVRWSCSRTMEDSLVAPWSATFHFCSLCRLLSSDQWHVPLVLLPTLLLQLPEYKHHWLWSSTDSLEGAVLRWRVLAYSAETLKRSITLWSYSGQLWMHHADLAFFLILTISKEHEEFDIQHRFTMLPVFWRDSINSCCLAALQLLYGFDSLFSGGKIIQFHIYWLLLYAENYWFLA